MENVAVDDPRRDRGPHQPQRRKSAAMEWSSKRSTARRKYAPVVTFANKARRDLWSNTVIAALRDAQPEIFE